MPLADTLTAHGQEPLVRHLATAPAAARQTLEAQLAALDWSRFDTWVRDYVRQAPRVEVPADLAPASFYPAAPATPAQHELYACATATGEALLRAGKVAAFTVAGGQGSRLGYEGPKGGFPISPVQRKPLFQLFAERLLRHGEIYGRAIPWYLMTSPGNDGTTRAFFAEHQHFGLDPANVVFLVQGTMPAFGLDGRLLLAEPGSLALAPDGHGGSLLALHQSGALADMARRGVEHLSYFQVDNPLVAVVDPLFLGLHHLTGSEMSNRSLPKREPFEKLGLFCRTQGRLQVIEYSDLPAALATQTGPDGRLRFLAGSPAIHVLRRDFIERLNQGHFQLPFHRAVKKVPYVDGDGRLVKPEQPNAVKLETFVFDALPLARRTLVLEAVREQQFAPVKNPSGEDSAESCQRLLQEEHARWLRGRGVALPRTADGRLACTVEISPRAYATEADFQRADLGVYSFAPGATVYIA